MRRFGVGEQDAADVVQEVFIVVYLRLHTLQQPESLRSWIYGITRRTVSTHRRGQRVRTAAGTHVELDDSLESDSATPFDLTAHGQDVALLSQLMSGIDEAKREVFALAEIDQLSMPEVAEVLGIPLNTAYSRLRSARKLFERALARHALREGSRGRGFE